MSNYATIIAGRLELNQRQVEKTIELLEQGATVPFIARYRKEATGSLNEVQIAAIRDLLVRLKELDKRREAVLQSIEEQGKLTPELRGRIEAAETLTDLEDLYLPYRPKRRTRATIALEKGYGPLADAIMGGRWHAGDGEYGDEELQYARDIIAERMSEDAAVRNRVRSVFRRKAMLTSGLARGVKEDDERVGKFESWLDWREPIGKAPSHRILALLRGEEAGVLRVHVRPDDGSEGIAAVEPKHMNGDSGCQRQMRQAAEDAYKRLVEPSIETEFRNQLKEKADREAIRVFADNLRQLLLAAPLGQKRTMAIDPGFRTGCKVVCLDEQGNLLCHDVIYPHPPVSKKMDAIIKVSDLVDKYKIEVIAIGSGTAGRETEDFVRKVGLPEEVRIFSVSEDGASVYSASDVGREEFPEYDVTVRGAVSIGRRLMDPLAELVKIDPKSLGVGQYQHDVDQSLLKEKLDNTVESCVNSVGVNLNTASPYLLRYVSGIGPALSKAITDYRAANGDFTSREQLKKVPRLGDKAFQQCAGFLRIAGAANPLDNSAVHPEAYHIVAKMARDLKLSTQQLVGNADACKQIQADKYVEKDFGLPTVNDIILELQKPGRDPRESAQEFSFAEDIHEIDDLKPGMELPGLVTNLTAFGAFVDIGLHENGLIHASQMGVRGMAVPSKVLKLHQHIMVEVLNVDLERNRISLRLIK